MPAVKTKGARLILDSVIIASKQAAESPESMIEGFLACLFTRLFTCYAAWLPAYFACLPALSPAVIS